MKLKRKIIRVHNTDNEFILYDYDGCCNETVESLIEWLHTQDPKGLIEHDHLGEEYYGLKIYTEREETDEEYNERIKKKEEARKLEEKYDREEFEKLKEKYGW